MRWTIFAKEGRSLALAFTPHQIFTVMCLSLDRSLSMEDFLWVTVLEAFVLESIGQVMDSRYVRIDPAWILLQMGNDKAVLSGE